MPCQGVRGVNSVCIVLFFPFFDGWLKRRDPAWGTFLRTDECAHYRFRRVTLPASEANGLPSGFFKRVCSLLMSNPHRKSICVLFWTVLSLLNRLYCRRNDHEFLRSRREEEDDTYKHTNWYKQQQSSQGKKNELLRPSSCITQLCQTAARKMLALFEYWDKRML